MTVMNRAERRKLRELHLQGPGRRKGSVVPLARDRDRFEIATWFLLTEVFLLDAYPAARYAVLLVRAKTPITHHTIDRFVSRISVDYASLRKRTEYTVGKARRQLSFASEQERAWLTNSAAHLAMLVECHARQQMGGFYYSLDQLRRLGWAQTLERLAGRFLGGVDDQRLQTGARQLAARKRSDGAMRCELK
jgi:hypothetical protein